MGRFLGGVGGLGSWPIRWDLSSPSLSSSSFFGGTFFFRCAVRGDLGGRIGFDSVAAGEPGDASHDKCMSQQHRAIFDIHS